MHTTAAIIVGASGFIGRNIVEALRGRVDMLVGVTGHPQSVPGCDHAVTLTDIDTLPALPAETVVVNVASMRYDARRFRADQPDILAVNMDIVNRVYGFCARRQVREVRYGSSSAVYPATAGVLDDDVPINLNAWPHDGEAAYAWSRRWGELAGDVYRRSHGINTLCFRLTNPFGPFDTLDLAAAHVASAFIIKALQPGPEFEVLGNPDAERDFVFAGDVAAVFRETLDVRGRNEAANIANGRTISIRQFAEAVLDAAESDKRIVLAGSAGGAGVQVRRATGERLFRLFPDLSPLGTLSAGLTKTVKWYRDALAQ